MDLPIQNNLSALPLQHRASLVAHNNTVSISFQVSGTAEVDQMKRRILSDGEEEEDSRRRNSQKKRKRISYQPSIDQSTQLQHCNWETKGNELPVTCGVKKGSLDVKRLAMGGDCILCDSYWFSPPAFETYAGKHSMRKWKASILYNDEPLQTLFDNGILTARSYKGRKATTTMAQKITGTGTDVESESSSEATEIHSGQQTEEDDLQDNDRLPEKGEQERQGAKSGGEVHTTEEEEDKIEEGEMEDESVPAVIDEENNNSVCEDMETTLIISTCGTMAARVVLKRLEEEKTERQSSCPGPEQPEDSWCMPLDDDTQNEEESQHNGSAIDDPCVTAVSQTDCWMSCVKSKRDESGDRKDGQTEIKTKTRKPTRSLSAPATSSKPEDDRSISDDTANIRTSPVSETSTSLANNVKDNCEEREDGVFEHCGQKEKEQQKKEHPEKSAQPSAAENIKNSSSENECTEPMSHSPKPLSEQADNPAHTDTTTNDQEAAQIQMMNQETSDPQTTHSPDMEEVLSSRRSAGINLDTMDLDQLKKEKIKMQIKVLKLQEEYYMMKIQGFRK